MLYSIESSQLQDLTTILNKIDRPTLPSDPRLVVYITQNSKPILQVGIYEHKEWLLTQQFVISAEYMKGLIDICINTQIPKELLSKFSIFTQVEEFI